MARTIEDPLTRLRTDGYAVLEGVLSGGEVGRMLDEVRPLLDATPHGRSDFEGVRTRRVYNLVAKTTAVHPLVEHPRVLELATEHLGAPGFQLSIAQAIEILPGESVQQLHTDDLPFPVPKPHRPIVMNTMWAITEFTRENGATRLAPGSGAATRPPPEDACVHAELAPGSVLVWDGSIWHGGGANTTDRSRVGLAINYNANWLRQQENQYLAVPAEMVGRLSDTLKRLLGYDLCGVLGSVDGRHPLRSV
jgi:ectoine hydroxylase-related dioxygenase (phytanoyl-CoA dioxygenase family)